MAYISLYRKYRSQSFGEVIGQDHVTTVLQNAIRMGRIAHAYLFCGPRGCGKTSTARLLARALNCVGKDGNATEPSAEPCGVCSLCEGIRSGSAMDVIEMDAASETGIDDVREKIIENAKFAPGEARYKVYIIDEVHDLSLKAFDSLLKTIEEPPAHVIFILATTEAHKVPITIRSRCQRMDFRRGTLQDLVGNIFRVLDLEGIGYEREAVSAVARAAEGSFRDSLSLLEQALAYTDGETLTAEAVHASIGTVGAQLLDEITRTLASDDTYSTFLKAGELVDSGKDVKQTLVALQGHLRDILVAGVARSEQALADVSPERFAQLKEQSTWFSAFQLLAMLDVLAEAERNLRFTNQHQRILEMALWNILPCHIATTPHAQHPIAIVSTPRPPVPPPQTQQSVEQVPPPVELVAVTSNSISQSEEAGYEDEEASGPFADAIDLEGIRRIWPRVVKRVLQKSRSAGAYFGKEEVVRLENHYVYVGFPKEFERSGADKPKGRELIEQVLAQELGISGWKVRCILLDTQSESVTEVSADTASLHLLQETDRPEAIVGNGFHPTLASDSLTEPVVAEAPARQKEESATKPGKAVDEEEEFLKLILEEFDGRIVDE